MFRLLIALLLGASLIVYAQDSGKVKVTFKVKTKNLPSYSKIYITGNSKELGSWQPDLVALEKIDESLWSKTILFSKKQLLEFKFTLGAWEKEALNTEGIIPPNNVVIANRDTTLTIIIENWKSGQRKFEGKVTGTVKYHHNIEGDGINPRDVIVWLPQDYLKDHSRHYPVLYMHDGQNIIDPATSSFGIDWSADETADSLIRSGKMQGIIIVGIYNTKDRTEEYSYTEKGYAYMSFIIEKLKPFIDSTYRTLADRNNTATMGSSMGGLISLMLAWEHPEIFSKAACLSSAFKIRQLDYVKKISEYNGPGKSIKLYIDDGGIALEQELRPGIEDAIKELKRKGFQEGKDLEVFFDPNAEHNERAWAKRLWRPMQFLFQSKPVE